MYTKGTRRLTLIGVKGGTTRPSGYLAAVARAPPSLPVCRCRKKGFRYIGIVATLAFSDRPRPCPSSRPSAFPPSSPLSSATVSGLSSVSDAARRDGGRELERSRGAGIGAKCGAPYGCVRGALRGELDDPEENEGDENVETDDTLDRGESGTEDACESLAWLSWSESNIRRAPDARRDDRGKVACSTDLRSRGLTRNGLTNLVVSTSPDTG